MEALPRTSGPEQSRGGHLSPLVRPGATSKEVRYVADVLVTMDEEGHVFQPGALDVVGGRITWVGPTEDAPTPASFSERRVGGLVMPGLVNAHAHSPMTLLRGVGEGLPLERWLADAIWPREARLTPEDVWWGMQLGSAELLRAGVTTTCEHYVHPRAVADAALAAGIRCVVAPGIMALPGAGPGATWERLLEDAGQVHGELEGCEGRLRVGLGPHSAYALPAEGLAA
ncbi:MAG: amidohydrolase family protein, partial [Acidimicrobiales bacterium]